MSDTSDSSSPDPDTVVVRAVFVPDGEDPPPEFTTGLSSLHFPATYDPETGVITTDMSEGSASGAVSGTWVSDDMSTSSEINGQAAAK